MEKSSNTVSTEKIIDSLEWILEGDRFGFGDNWKSEDDTECEEELAGYYVRRTIEYLKEHMPRVMTLEEAAAAEVCWLEDRKAKTLKAVGVYQESYIINAYPPGKCADSYDKKKYGKTYRCWTQKPDEQMMIEAEWRK